MFKIMNFIVKEKNIARKYSNMGNKKFHWQFFFLEQKNISYSDNFKLRFKTH